MNVLKRLVVHVISERDALSKQLDAWDHARGWKFDGRDPSEVGNLPEAEWKNRERWARDLEAPAPESLSELVGKLWTHNGFTEFDNLDRDVISAGMRLNLGAGVETDLNDLRRARHAMISAVCDMMTCDGPSTLFGVESAHQLNEALSRLMRRVPAFDIAEKPKSPATSDTTPHAAKAKTDGAVTQGVFVYNEKRAENIPPAPWRLLEFMEGQSEADIDEAYRYAVGDHSKDPTSSAINSMIRKANEALESVEYPSRLSHPKNVYKIIWA